MVVIVLNPGCVEVLHTIWCIGRTDIIDTLHLRDLLDVVNSFSGVLEAVFQ